MFTKKSKKSFGLDIGNYSIKLISLENVKGAVVVDNFIVEKIQNNTADSIKEQIKKFNIGKDPVSISVSGPNALIRFLTFPKLTQSELKNSLSFEVEKHIPYPINEVYLDSCILKDLPDKKMLVLVVAAKKIIIDERIKFAQELGLNLSTIDVDSISLINSFNFFNKQPLPEPAALLNIGSQVSNLTIVENLKPEFCRDLLVGGNILTQGISEKLNLSLEQAENIKCTPKENKEKITSALEPLIQNFCLEVRASFDYYENQTRAAIKKIFICGGGANFNGLEGILQNFLGIETKLWPNLDSLALKENLDLEGFKAGRNSLMLAFGLALRGL